MAMKFVIPDDHDERIALAHRVADERIRLCDRPLREFFRRSFGGTLIFCGGSTLSVGIMADSALIGVGLALAFAGVYIREFTQEP